MNNLKRRVEEIKNESLLNNLIDFRKRYLLAEWDFYGENALNYKQEITDIINNKVKHNSLYIAGNIGVGKSSLITLMMIELVKNCEAIATYVQSSHLFSCMIDNKEQYNRYKKSWVLVIDDFGAEYCTPYHTTMLDEFIEYRYSRCDPTFFTSNIKIQDLNREGWDRIKSRLSDNTWIKEVIIKGKDRRKTK